MCVHACKNVSTVCVRQQCQHGSPCVHVCLYGSAVCVSVCVNSNLSQHRPPPRGKVSTRTRLSAPRPEHSPGSAPWAPLASRGVCLLGRAGRWPSPTASHLPHGHLASTLSVLKPTRAQRMGPRLHRPSPEPTTTRVPTLAPATHSQHVTHPQALRHAAPQRERETSLHDGQPSRPTCGAQTREQKTRELCFCPTLHGACGP